MHVSPVSTHGNRRDIVIPPLILYRTSHFHNGAPQRFSGTSAANRGQWPQKEKRNLSNICTGGRTGKLETPRNTHLALRGENLTKSTSKKRQPESRNGKKDRGEYGIYYSCCRIWGCTRDEPTHIIGPVIKPVRIPRIWRRGQWYARSPKCGGTRTHYQTLTPDAPRLTHALSLYSRVQEQSSRKVNL